MIPDHENPNHVPAPERYSADWFLAQLSGHVTETAGDVDAPEVVAEPLTAPPDEAPSPASIQGAAPRWRFRRSGAIAVAALGLCLAAIAFAATVPPAVQSPAANAEPVQGDQGHGIKPLQLPTYSVPDSPAPPVPDGTDPEDREIHSPPRTPTDDNAPVPSSSSTPRPGSTPTPTPSDAPTPTATPTSTPTPSPTSAPEPSEEPTDDPSDPPVDPPTDDTCILFIICF